MKLCAFAMAALIGLVTGCSSSGPAGKGDLTGGQRQTDRGSFGQVTAAESGGLPVGPPELALYEQKGSGRGLIAAAWSDGTIVFAARVDAPGAELRIGKTDSVRVSRVMELCDSAEVGTKVASMPAADSPQRVVALKVKGSPNFARAWSTSGTPSTADADAVNACEFCAARTIALIPFDGGRTLAAPAAWIAQVQKFAQSGKWEN